MKAKQFQLLLIYESSLVIPRNVRPPLLGPLASPLEEHGEFFGIVQNMAIVITFLNILIYGLYQNGCDKWPQLQYYYHWRRPLPCPVTNTRYALSSAPQNVHHPTKVPQIALAIVSLVSLSWP